jgi:uncharacterized membrane protein
MMILFIFIICACLYPQLPERMASHWNTRGEVDGYISKFWGMFLLPFILLGITLLFIAVPRIDPLKANIEQFRSYYDGFITLLLIFMLVIHVQLILWNIGIKISPNITVPVGLGILFFYIGILFEKAKRNWFIGIRTPWTLSSEQVWDKTHQIGGRLFKIAGIISLLGILSRDHALFFVIVPVIVIAVYLVIYSYLAFQKEMKGK